MADTSSQGSAAPMAEVTIRAVALGIFLALLMGVANVYLGLFAGMTVSASIPAAVMSMGILRGLMRRGTILENNIVQTIASAGESLAAGIIFTMPALIITGIWTEFDFWVTTLVAMAGGLLGVLFMIPLRKPMIVEDKELVYPEGVACAKVLEAGESGGSGMLTVFSALGLGAFVKALIDGVGLLGDQVKAAITLGPAHFFVGIFAAPALVGVGFIVGLNIAVLVFVGGAVSWLVAGPLMTTLGDAYATMPQDEIYAALKTNMRFLGVGAMIVGGLWSIIMIRNGIVRGVQETVRGYGAAAGRETVRTETDMDRRWLLLLVVATSLIVLGLYSHLTGDMALSVTATVLMIVCSFFFVAVASYIVGLVGSSNSPVSGMTICSVLLTSAFVALFGFSGEAAILATLGVAGVVCCATCTSGDVCQDLKTGSLLGATPYRQQWVEIIGVIAAAFVMQPVLAKLHAGYGIATDAHLPPELQGSALEAPQAALFASLMNGFFGDAKLPWDLIGYGCAVGLAIILVDQLVLRPRRASFRLHVMPVAVGMYLPFGLSAAILVGGLLAWIAGRGATSPEHKANGLRFGVLLASGLIAGEAIAGVLIAIPRAAEVELPHLLDEGTLQTALTTIAMALICLWMVVASRPRED